MNKGELVKTVASEAGSKVVEAKKNVEVFSKVVAAALLSGEEVTLPGVGKLKIKNRPARAGRNPKTGAAISIPAKRVVKFAASAEFATVFNAVGEALTAS